MFARTAARTALRATPSARVGLAPRLTARLAPIQRRAASSTSTPPPVHQSVVIKFIKDIPVDVYPLAFLVTAVVSSSIFMCGWSIAHSDLRLLPSRARSH